MHDTNYLAHCNIFMPWLHNADCKRFWSTTTYTHIWGNTWHYTTTLGENKDAHSYVKKFFWTLKCCGSGSFTLDMHACDHHTQLSKQQLYINSYHQRNHFIILVKMIIIFIWETSQNVNLISSKNYCDKILRLCY